MANTYISNYQHIIFSTKSREPLISENIQEELWNYISGIAANRGFKVTAIGGTRDHVHILMPLPATITISKAVQLIKGVSSKWLSERLPKLNNFNWQSGYGAFSINVSMLPQTSQYIRGQEEHHQKISFRDEYLAILQKHGIQYDEQYVVD